MKALTYDVMRGNSACSVGDRELMAAYVCKLNECPFCVAAQTATASRAYDDQDRVQATLADPDTAPIEEPLRATLKMLGKLTIVGTVDAEDILSVLADGGTVHQVEDALAVCFAFNTTNRLANAFGFEVLRPQGFEAGAKYLLKRGYR
jgi:AhpD family alkylhydroperoxidase